MQNRQTFFLSKKLKLEINNGLFETEKVKFQRKLVKNLIFGAKLAKKKYAEKEVFELKKR